MIDLGLLDRVDIRHAVPRHTVPGLYAEVDALVNDMREGAADKVVYEAAATLHARPRLEPGLRHAAPAGAPLPASGDVDGLALAIVGLLSADRDAVGRSLREIVVREHSVETWADRVVVAVGVSARVLHVAKVSGISGSENHLLLLLPALAASAASTSSS